jgi:hypothetical protein
MKLDEFKNNPGAQRKTWYFAGAVLLVVLVLFWPKGQKKPVVRPVPQARPCLTNGRGRGTLINGVCVAPAIAGGKLPPVADPPTVENPPATVPIVPPAPQAPAPLKLQGSWRGSGAQSKEVCTLNLEIGDTPDKAGYSGYSTIRCSPLFDERMMRPTIAAAAEMRVRMNPASAVLMSGSAADNKVIFEVEQNLSTLCPLQVLTVQPFGTTGRELSVFWKDGCREAALVLTRIR